MILAGDYADARAVARFRAEAEAVARLQHPNIVQIHHIVEATGLPFFELEYLEGGSLDRRLDGLRQACLHGDIAVNLLYGHLATVCLFDAQRLAFLPIGRLVSCFS
jgi:serine/threonine protein kinase